MKALTLVLLVAVPNQAPVDDGWRNVMKLKQGTAVRVTASGTPPADAYIALADADRIVIVMPALLPSAARAALLDIATNYHGIVGMRPRFSQGKLVVDPDTITWDGVKIAETNRVIVEMRRDAIVEILRPGKGSLIGGALGVAAGGVAGVLIAFNQAMTPCVTNCGAKQGLALSALIGLPIAGGYAGSRAGKEEWDTVYRKRG